MAVCAEAYNGIELTCHKQSPSGGGAMRYLFFLLWIPAAFLLYLSIHQEIVAQKGREAHTKPVITAHAGHPH